MSKSILSHGNYRRKGREGKGSAALAYGSGEKERTNEGGDKRGTV